MLQIGRWAVHGLELGSFRLDGGAMFGVVPKTLWSKQAPPDEENRIQLSLRALLLVSSDHVVVVDCGIGDLMKEDFCARFAYDDKGENLLSQLAAHGVAPEDVTDLILTHLHFDHVGGAVRKDATDTLVPTFPSARVHVQSEQWEWAMKPSLRDRASFIPDTFMALGTPLLHLHDGTQEILPGLEVFPCSGHTPGMQILRLQGDPGLVYGADLVPTSAHLPPPWVMGYDLEPLKALQEKLDLYDQVARSPMWLVFEHDPHLAAARLGVENKRIVMLETRESL